MMDLKTPETDDIRLGFETNLTFDSTILSDPPAQSCPASDCFDPLLLALMSTPSLPAPIA